MLRELEVRDLGIIEKVSLQFPAGFIVLTGETGAGKSLLVQSLQLLAGERADAEAVRSGNDRLLVEGCFVTPPDAGARELLAELGVDGGEELVLRREVSAAGRSRAWVNDVTVTVGALQRIAPYLLAIHGQHEQRGLTDPATHIALVDAAGALTAEREQVAVAFAAWQENRQRLESQRRALGSRRDRLDVIAFQAREIDEARPLPGEEEALREERAFLQHAERIGELVAAALAALGGDGGAVALARAARAVRELQELGIGVGDTAAELEQAQVLAEEAERAVQGLTDRVRPAPQRLEEVESRLASLERLARKYGGTLEAVLEHRARLQAEREQLEGVEDDIARLAEAGGALAARYLELARALSRKRAAAAERFSARVVEVLKGLGIPRARLRLALGLRACPGRSARGGRGQGRAGGRRHRRRRVRALDQPRRGAALDGAHRVRGRAVAHPPRDADGAARPSGAPRGAHAALRRGGRRHRRQRRRRARRAPRFARGARPGAGRHPPARRWPAGPPRTSWCARKRPAGAP